MTTITSLLRTYLLNCFFLWKLHCAPTVIHLDGDWIVKNRNQSIEIIGNVPGGIYTDLQRNKVIDDPYFRYNDIEYRWIGKENWVYSRNFTVTSLILKYTQVNLVCDGLDTVSDVFVNGKFVGSSDNMFVKFIFEMKPYLKEGVNNIEIRFGSPVTYSKEQYDKYLYEKYAVYPICPLPLQHGECHANFIRKIQSQFSWDWGPAFPSMGIWKNISIEAFNEAEIRAVTVFTHEKNSVRSNWRIDLRIFFDVVRSNTGVLKVLLNSKEEFREYIQLKRTVGKSGQAVVNVFIPELRDIETWWPNGFGNQPLYNLTVVHETSTGSLSSKSMKIGFRTVELVQEPIANATGLSFYFKVNGVAIFMKGSNWIPADSFPERVTVDYTRRLLQSAKDAHMNLLRVWGGGMYETDAFYEIADELGIMLWHDFMLACALYPTSNDFLNSIKTEIGQQVQRLQHHPSILIWGGNNENEVALAQNWWFIAKVNLNIYNADYLKLYIDTIRPLATSLDPSRPFVSSSPSNGIETEKEGWLSENPQSNLYGDVHFYDYLSDSWDWKTFPTARFVSEYGFQSWPSFETLSKVSESQDWNYDSRFMSTRQHSIFGNDKILFGIRTHMDTPNKCNVIQLLRLCNSTEVFENMLYLTQIYQAMSVKTETEHYLRSQSDINNSEGKTMGALYWQLNDIWQGPSWASIEYGGKWKMLHYYAVNFFAPLLVSPLERNDKLEVFGIANAAFQISKLVITITVYRWNNLTPIYFKNITYTQKPSCSQLVHEEEMDSLLKTAGCPDRQHCFLYFTMINPITSVELSNNFLLLTTFIDAKGLQTPNLKVTVAESEKGDNKNQFVLHVNSDAIAPFVWLEAVGVSGQFSDNGFLLVSQKKRILFHSFENATVAKLTENLSVKSLLNIY